MSASLVGSEMCIRDSFWPVRHSGAPHAELVPKADRTLEARFGNYSSAPQPVLGCQLGHTSHGHPMHRRAWHYASWIACRVVQ
eukprot:608615-Alexandrium_andersonii.AAC.1